MQLLISIIPSKFPYFASKHNNLENNHPYPNGHRARESAKRFGSYS